MQKNEASTGACVFCGVTFKKSGMTRHLKSCAERQKQMSVSEGTPDKAINLYHLLIQAAYRQEYWLHLEMSGTAKLKKLDDYLRAIWLECCGHLSEFSYERWNDVIPTNFKADNVFEPGIQIYHMYDFGDTSETRIKVIEKRKGIPQTRKPIYLMARNDAPDYRCKECAAQASWLCLECMYDDEDYFFCDKHIESHPHDEYGDPVEIVNSPRTGMCGYVGPADPPY